MNISVVFLAALLGLPAIVPAQQMGPQPRAPDDSIATVASTRRTFTSQDIQRLPVRGMPSYLALLPGVVQQNGSLHIRGVRAGENAYCVDGIPVTNRFFNRAGVAIIPDAVAQLDIYTGAYGADWRGANGGQVHTQMRSGGERNGRRGQH